MILIDKGEQGDQIYAVSVKCDKRDDRHPFESTSHHKILLIKGFWNVGDGQKLGWMTYD